MTLRLDKFLADMGFGTRSELRALIRAGRVYVNGRVCTRPEEKTDTAAEVTVDGERIVYRPYTVVMLAKPAGVLSATEDGRGAKTAADLMTGRYANMALKPAGRLDKDATGLLIMTNDGALIHGIITPNRQVEKQYYVTLSCPLPSDAAERFAGGLTLEDGFVCREAWLLYQPGALEARAIVTEGKFHQVKRMFAAVGSTVLTLRRERVAQLWLDPDLEDGMFRELTAEETLELRRAAGLTQEP